MGTLRAMMEAGHDAWGHVVSPVVILDIPGV